MTGHASLNLHSRQACEEERFWVSKKAISTTQNQCFSFLLQRRMNLEQSPLSSAAIASLREQMRVSQRHSGGVFELTGTPLFSYTARGLSGAFLKLCRNAKIEDFHFHDIRHEVTSCFFEKELNRVGSSNHHRTQSPQDVNAPYPIMGRGFGREIEMISDKVSEDTMKL